MRSVPHGVSLLLMCAQAAAAVVHSSAHRCCVGETYTMGLIPMSAKPWYTFDSSTNTFSGFIPSAMDIVPMRAPSLGVSLRRPPQIAEETGMTITLVQVNLSSAIFENFYYELQNGVYDFGVGSDELDTYFTPEAGLLFTLPYIRTAYTGVSACCMHCVKPPPRRWSKRAREKKACLRLSNHSPNRSVHTIHYLCACH